MGKLAHDNKALGSADTVNDAVVLRKFMPLSGEICLIMRCWSFVVNHKLGIAAGEVTRLLKLGRSQQRP